MQDKDDKIPERQPTRGLFGRPDLVKEVHLRIPLPVVIPVVALAAIGLLALGFARVMLEASRDGAIALAIVASVSILGGSTFVATRPRLDKVAWAELAAIIVVPLILAAGIASVADGPATAPGVAQDHAPPAPAPIEVLADGLQFDTAEITLRAEAETMIAFDNQDLAPHNIAIYPDEASGRALESALFDGVDVQPGSATVYEFESPPAGTYYFQCDLHPDMNGTVIVS